MRRTYKIAKSCLVINFGLFIRDSVMKFKAKNKHYYSLKPNTGLFTPDICLIVRTAANKRHYFDSANMQLKNELAIFQSTRCPQINACN